MAEQTYFSFNILAFPNWGLFLLASFAIYVPLYLYQVFEYHRAHQSRKPGQIPPAFPVLFPPLGALLPLVWDARHTLDRYTSVPLGERTSPDSRLTLCLSGLIMGMPQLQDLLFCLEKMLFSMQTLQSFDRFGKNRPF